MALAALASLAIGGQIFGGISAYQSGKDQQSQLEQSAELARQEAQAEADRKSEERRKFIAQQKVSYLANGIGLTGAPLVTFSSTYDQYQKEINATIKAGNAKADYYNSEAKIAGRTARASLISGVTQAAGTAYTTKDAFKLPKKV